MPTSHHPTWLALLVLLAGNAWASAAGNEETPPPRQTEAAAYYIDGRARDNQRSGTSPEDAWKDFTPINGKTLGPGERLLIKRGSVIRQELRISARGTADRWAEIGAYGEGPRPILCRDWDIEDRCLWVTNPDYLRIRSLTVCYAAKGLVVTYTEPGHEGLIIEDCMAHHIEGLYRPNSSGIPEWRDRPGPQGDGLNASAGIAVVGTAASNVTVRDCDIFQTSWGFFLMGARLTVDRVYCHHCYVHNTSPHPALVQVRDAEMRNSIFDASGGHASAGTMGIMLVDPRNLAIHNCTFRNVPDSGCHDEGGIDFEAHGDGCLIDGCTFENNAGAAIEVLGLKSPQPKNVEIRRSRFIKNNWAAKLGPGEIYIWGQANPQDPAVCCSTGLVAENGYVLLPGVQFFVNEAPTLTQWTLRDNTPYPDRESLDRAMPYNNPPVVEAGPDIYAGSSAVKLQGSVSDDGRPKGNRLGIRWEVLEGPGAVAFQDAGAAVTTATFSIPGDYLLRLVGDDGELWVSDLVAVHVLPAGQTAAMAWDFNGFLDKEGWTEHHLGTRKREEPHPQWPTQSLPVQYVSGGYYILAVEDSTDAHLLSPDNLAVNADSHTRIRLRFMNHTPAAKMRLRFTTDDDPAWDDVKSREFATVPNDDAPREYVVEMTSEPGWKGTLKQLRLDLGTGESLTGTCRFDYIAIVGGGQSP